MNFMRNRAGPDRQLISSSFFLSTIHFALALFLATPFDLTTETHLITGFEIRREMKQRRKIERTSEKQLNNSSERCGRGKNYQKLLTWSV